MIINGFRVMMFKRNIPSTQEAIEQTIFEALDFLSVIRTHGRARNVDAFHYRLALDESLENALRHGNRFNPNRLISLVINADDARAYITVRDEGEGFAVDRVPDPVSPEHAFKPNGRGLHLLKNLFNVEWQDGGRCIRIEV
jgi:anti-sigma regulatory factor (Ser/Thr protein kinase)